MLKGDLLEAEVWGGFGVATVGLRIAGEEAGMRCRRVSPRMVKGGGRKGGRREGGYGGSAGGRGSSALKRL